MNLRLTDVVKNLLIINVLFFLGTIIMGDGRKILALYYFEGPDFAPYQIATHFFMHSDFGHLLFNMFGLVMFGPALEALWGEKRFLIFYFVTAMGSALLHTGVQYYELHSLGNQAIIYSSAWGASGAIYGILAGFALKFPHVKLSLLFLPIALPAGVFVALLIGWDLFSGLGSLNTGIAHFAHIGGAVAGYFLVKYWEKN